MFRCEIVITLIAFLLYNLINLSETARNGNAAQNSIIKPQDYYPKYGKLESCPPPLPVSICYEKCHHDNDCPDIEKCCKTHCGGSVCSRPVTRKEKLLNKEKNGECPATPGGPWICSDMCTMDDDCLKDLKCCKNRCGAKVCTKPFEEEKEEDDKNDEEHEGECPEPDSGPWICTSSCKKDKHCSKDLKCCKNRCGANVCTKPMLEDDWSWSFSVSEE